MLSQVTWRKTSSGRFLESIDLRLTNDLGRRLCHQHPGSGRLGCDCASQDHLDRAGVFFSFIIMESQESVLAPSSYLNVGFT